MPIKLEGLTIKKAHDHLMNGDFSAVELTEAYLDEIKKKDGEIHAYLEVFDDALDAARKADEKIAELRKETGGQKADSHMLLGIPIAIKDNILIKGKIASAASKMLENYHATYNATVITKLGKAGAIFLGRTNMDEFAMGGSTENSAYGVTKNPNDLSRVAGGSSGGSAAAVAANMALAALGSDTGGSIRQPASFCGVVGLKPTYGRVSRYGVMAMGSSLDQIGPFAKTVEDAEIVLECVSGKDEKDGTTIDNDTYAKVPLIGKKKPTIGIPRHFLGGDGINKEVMKVFEEAVKKFEAKGYEIREIKLPNISYSLLVYYIIMPAEVSANMARFDGMRFGLRKDGKNGIDEYFESRRAGLGSEVIRRILLGTYVLSSGYYDAYYNRANAVRRMITEDFMEAFKSVDVIITPTAPSPAFKIGEKTSDPVAMYLEDIFTVTANLTGLPAISVPANREESNVLPIGIQITGRHGDEKTIFEVGKDLLFTQ
jgi:aspartyl-tRNA(Asn)/glutamyl-tRNA(Gln) amidotransferase subunit A